MAGNHQLWPCFDGMSSDPTQYQKYHIIPQVIAVILEAKERKQ
jgi:hypothetical protein